MKINVLKDILIESDQIDRYFENTVPLDLWRAMKKHKSSSPFEFVEQPYTFPNGRPRPADISMETRSGEPWVLIKDRPRGLSTFDKPGVPPGKGWEYYKIPAGTVLPEGLAIVEDEHNARFNATHYTIAPAYDMPLAVFKLLLNELARSLIKEAV